MKPTLAEVTAATAELAAANETLDRHQLRRIEQDLVTMMMRHGRGKIIGIAVEAIRQAEQRGAKW